MADIEYAQILDTAIKEPKRVVKSSKAVLNIHKKHLANLKKERASLE